MSTPRRKHCSHCGTKFENNAAPFCPECGKARDGLTGTEVLGCLATSYRVMLADRTVIGPVPASTIISMIKAGTIQPDHPVVNMDTGKAFFPDEDPVIRFLVGLDAPFSTEAPRQMATVSHAAAPYFAPAHRTPYIAVLLLTLIATALLSIGRQLWATL